MSKSTSATIHPERRGCGRDAIRRVAALFILSELTRPDQLYSEQIEEGRRRPGKRILHALREPLPEGLAGPRLSAPNGGAPLNRHAMKIFQNSRGPDGCSGAAEPSPAR